jgi:hypothetical protein
VGRDERGLSNEDQVLRHLAIARIASLNQIRHLGFTAPDELRERLRGVSRHDLAEVAAGLAPPAVLRTI